MIEIESESEVDNVQKQLTVNEAIDETITYQSESHEVKKCLDTIRRVTIFDVVSISE